MRKRTMESSDRGNWALFRETPRYREHSEGRNPAAYSVVEEYTDGVPAQQLFLAAWHERIYTCTFPTLGTR